MPISIRALAIAAGGLFAATAAIDIPHDQASEFAGAADYLLEACFAASLVVSAVALTVLLRAADTRIARLGWTGALVGTATLGVVVSATLLRGAETLDAVFPVGFLALLLGFLVLGVADLAGRLSPRFAGTALLLSGVGIVALGDGYGLVAWSAGWFAVAALVASPVGVTEIRASGVRT